MFRETPARRRRAGRFSRLQLVDRPQGEGRHSRLLLSAAPTWGWATRRIKRMRKFVDHILCGLPFEPKWYAERGLHAEYVGHPFFDDVAESRLDEAFCRKAQADDRRIVGVLPGSRNHEVESNFPLQIDLMEQVASRHPDVHFLVGMLQRATSQALPEDAGRPTAVAARRAVPGPHAGDHRSLRLLVMVSGSVSLEMLARAKLAVVLYRVSPLTYALVRPLVHVKSITLPNLIAGRRLMPEWMPVLRPRSHGPRDGGRRQRMDRQPLPARPGRPRAATASSGNRPPGATGRTADRILSHLAPVDRSGCRLNPAARWPPPETSRALANHDRSPCSGSVLCGPARRSRQAVDGVTIAALPGSIHREDNDGRTARANRADWCRQEHARPARSRLSRCRTSSWSASSIARPNRRPAPRGNWAFLAPIRAGKT